MSESIIYDKSRAFSVRIVKLYQYLTESKNEYIMSKQLLRCGTSIGANVAESLCSISEKDFLSKMYIAYKECAETQYWLELLCNTGYISKKEYNSINCDCEEINRILASITKSLKIKINSEK